MSLKSHLLTDLLNERLLQPISSAPRFIQPEILHSKEEGVDFVSLEHLALNFTLRDKAKPWWTQPHAHLFGEIQRQTRFRKSRPTQSYVLRLTDNGLTLEQWDPFEGVFVDSAKLHIEPEIMLCEGVSIWGDIALPAVIERLGEAFDLSEEECCQRFSTLDLSELNPGEKWRYHPALGVFRGTECPKS